MVGAHPFSLEWYLWIAIGAGYCVLLVRLWQTGLWRRYRAFLVYIAVNVSEQAALLSIDARSDLYGWVFLGFVPLRSVCAVLVVLEIFGLVLRDYRGVGSLGRWAIWTGLLTSAVLAGVSIYPDLSVEPGPYPLVAHAAVFERALSSALLLFLVLITAFLLWFPVPLSRNTVIHTVVFAIYFSSRALLLLVRNVLAGASEAVRVEMLSTGDMAVSLLCVVAWIVLLAPSGETATMIFGHRWGQEEGERLVRQLDTVNTTLMRVARK